MKNFRTLLLVSVILLFTVFTVDAGTRVVVQVEVIEGGNIEKSIEIITFNKDRFRIDFPGAGKDVTDQSPYIMTVNGGENWVIGDKSKDGFYCTEMKTEEFFRTLGDQATDAIEFFNVTAESPTVKKVLEEPGPDIEGFKTTHLQIETNASAYARFLFIKFEYKVKIIDDLWYTTELDVHPVRKKWINALTQSGNNLIDKMFADYTAKLPGAVLRQESVIDITNVRKKETKTQKKRSVIKKVEELKASELDMIFTMPECKPMDDDEVQEKAKTLFSADKIML
jgi:hypothetical protein